ncbi:MAG: hypothetical protein B655_2195 [Methanobacterium sp. Maddingley MBC34]|nr:MAG: hypothetical protein B655_2195 [Methanobacterium sp. Maddingley MBC34]
MLTLITVGIITYLLSVQMKIGVPYWDVFNYLNTATYFAGMGVEGVTDFIYLPPLIPFLTSIIFRMGYVSLNAIFIVSGVISILGVLGLYLLLKQRFNPIQSFTGSLIFISLPIIMSWATSGGIDIPGVVFSIWAIYFLVIGVREDPKFLYLVLPVLILAFLARYTAGLIIIPILLYCLINLDLIKQIENIKKVILWIAVEFTVLFTLSMIFLVKLGILSSIYTLIIGVLTSSSTGVGDVAYNPNVLYYLENLLNYISISPITGTYQQILNPSQGTPSILAYLICLITVLGLLFYVYQVFSSKVGIKNENNSKTMKSLINIPNLTKTSLITGLIIACAASFYFKSFIVSEMILLVTLYILYKFLTRGMVKHHHGLGLDLMFLSWFCAYLIFQGILPIKVDRYFITMAPALVYFIILGFSGFIKMIEPKIKYENMRSWGIYIILALVFLSSATATYMGHTPKKTFTVDIGNSCEWIMENDPNYQDKVISSDYPNAVTWYLKKEILGGYPRFFNSPDEFADYLQKNDVDYYIDSLSNPHPDLNGYRIIKSFGVVVIYQKIVN